jgi:hypothetical protein
MALVLPRRIMLAAAFLIGTAAIGAFSDDKPPLKKTLEDTPGRVLLKSAYLVDPIVIKVGENNIKVHRITLTGILGETGSLILDGNECSVNSFGDADECTTVEYMPIAVKLTNLATKDPTGNKRTLGEVGDAKIDKTLRFVLSKNDPNQSPRFILLDKEVKKTERVLTAELLTIK